MDTTNSRLLARRAAKRFELRLEQRPVSAVSRLFGAHLRIERLAQRVDLAGNGETQQRPALRLRIGLAGKRATSSVSNSGVLASRSQKPIQSR